MLDFDRQICQESKIIYTFVKKIQGCKLSTKTII